MDTGLYRIELTALAGLVRIAGIGGGFSGDPEKTAPEQARTFRAGSLWFPAALVIGFGAWILLSGYSSKPAEGETASPATAVTNITLDGSMLNPPATPEQVTAAAEMAPVNGLTISSQSWRRGGLGSKALVTFTLRNGNAYPVKDIEISCAFARRDGSHLTDRTRMIPDTVKSRGRRTFARLHVGFVNVNADRAKCSLLTASRV
jgi:hypothetical protein